MSKESMKVPPEQQQAQSAKEANDRVDQWKRKLLDLTRRNRLLNFKDTLLTIEIKCPDLPALFTSLENGERFEVLECSDDICNELRDEKAHSSGKENNHLDKFISEEFKSKRLRSTYGLTETNKKLRQILRTAQESMEEGGASALYLVLGFLEWYERDDSDVRSLAPIILVPLALERGSIKDKFRIRAGEDEPQINVTLLERLSQDFGVRVDNSPNQNDIDVDEIFASFRKAINGFERWALLEKAYIGIFSFSKFLMWRDLEERENDLRQNKIVKHLIENPTEAYPDNGEFPDEETLDDTYLPKDTFCPLPYDSSQLAAIHAAAEGKSFVLHGPPGTGKSQTIANLIAHCLTIGKSVLFVSEKMAALNVVQRRLANCGLAEYCLELHSNKAVKQEVIQQLGSSLEYQESHSEVDWPAEANKLASARNELNLYVRALHKKRELGESVFQVRSRLIGLKDINYIQIPFIHQKHNNREFFEKAKQIIKELQAIGDDCGLPDESLWKNIKLKKLSASDQRHIEDVLESLSSSASLLMDILDDTAECLKLEPDRWLIKNILFVNNFVRFMLSAPKDIPLDLLESEDWDDTADLLKACITHGKERDTVRDALSQIFSLDVVSCPSKNLLDTLQKAATKNFVGKWLAGKKIKKHLRPFLLDKQQPLPEDLEGTLRQVEQLRKESELIEESSERAEACIKDLWNEGEADWKKISEVVEWCTTFRKHVNNMAGKDSSRFSRYFEVWCKLVAGEESLQSENSAVFKTFKEFTDRCDVFKDGQDKLQNLLHYQVAKAQENEFRDKSLTDHIVLLNTWKKNIEYLRGWSKWQHIRHEAVSIGLETLVDLYENCKISSNQLLSIFERSFYQWWLEYTCENSSVLSAFNRPVHERQIEEFRELDKYFFELSKREIRARIASHLPKPGGQVNNDSEVGILKREMQKQRRHMPIRKLMKEIPNLLPRLKPCLLMSPISIAQYLDPAHSSFDIVVFDEASQITTWDAVGAIARGKEAVIVGDPKQLPPTSFFSRAADDDEIDEDAREDLQSILDECIASRLPPMHLSWHYRSRHENLIAFSNNEYYENRLLTFPSRYQNQGIEFRFVDGKYDRGASRTNRIEAEAIVQEIENRLENPELSESSIGIVTFSVAQQNLILDLLEKKASESVTLDQALNSKSLEPLFVKNLENVQGDERDVILFSICYGPDKQGRIYHNFGPIAKEGGHRRLNVAITRARSQIIVFSSLRADQINLAQARSRGASDLKKFLDFAERGQEALDQSNAFNLDADFDSPFEKQVYEELRDKGHEVHLQVGCSGYRIDLAVVDPDSPGAYLLGIECDGANYHRAKTARDRDQLRQAVLENLGWKIHRIWSTDWWHNKEKELKRLEEAIQDAQRNVSRGCNETPIQEEVKRLDTKEVVISPRPTSQIEALENEFPVYKPFVPNFEPSDRDFYSETNDRVIIELLNEVVLREGPISIRLATRRILTCWDQKKVTEKALKRVKQLLQIKGTVVFLWPSAVDPAQYTEFRIPVDTDENTKRRLDELPPEEIANAAYYVLNQQISIPESSLIQEVALLFGYKRCGDLVKQFVSHGIKLLIEQQRAHEQGDKIVLGKKENS